MCCIIGTWVQDHLLYEARPNPLGFLHGGLTARVYAAYLD
jgi:hypothetical protein